MNCIIPGLNLKIFSKALHALAKVGDQLYLEASDTKCTFLSLNLRKTVCVRYTFLDTFFSSLELTEKKDVLCKIQMKTLLPLFRGTHLEKKFEFVKIQHEKNDDKLTFKMKYKCDDIIMLHKLRLMEPELLRIEMFPNDGCNDLIGTSSFFNQLLNTFSNTDEEMTLEIAKHNVTARNYCVGVPMKPRSVRSHVNLSSSEFSRFSINNETNINFSLKPLRTAIHFAEGFNLNIALNFEKGGKPLIVVMKNSTFEVNFIVATLDPYGDGYSSKATCSIPAQVTQIKTNHPNLTVEDQEALLNENWDEFDVEMDQHISKHIKKKKANGLELFERKNKGTYGDHEKKDTDNNTNNIVNGNNNNLDFIPSSPESPKTKKAKLVFGRCFESTFSKNCLGEVLAPNSDSD